jgi:hypothetical protein
VSDKSLRSTFFRSIVPRWPKELPDELKKCGHRLARTRTGANNRSAFLDAIAIPSHLLSILLDESDILVVVRSVGLLNHE